MTAVAERAAAQPVGQDGSAAIRSTGLTKRFPGGQIAVDAVDLVVPRGVGLAPRDRLRQPDVLLGAQRRHQVVSLEDEPDPVTT